MIYVFTFDDKNQVYVESDNKKDAWIDLLKEIKQEENKMTMAQLKKEWTYEGHSELVNIYNNDIRNLVK